MSATKKWGWILLGGMALVLLVGAGLRDLWDPDEPRYAQVAREMIQSGDWVIPHLNGEVYADKPPLHFWAIAAASKIFGGGDVNAWTARLPSALAAVLTLLGVWRLGARMFGEAAGLFSVMVLATTYRFFMQGAWAQMEILLCLFILAALYSFWRAYADEEKLSRLQKFFLWSGFYLSLALGFLTKGPVGILFPCGIIFFFLWWERRLAFLSKMWIPLGILILLVVGGSWVGAAYYSGGSAYLSEHFIRHNFTRYTDPWGHARPIYYYFLYFPADSMPWFLFLPAALFRAFLEVPSPRTSARRFLCVWVALIFIFFSLSSSKRGLYLTALYPAVAIFLGEYMASPATTKRLKRVFSAVAGVAAVLLIAALWVAFPQANPAKSARPLTQRAKEIIGADGKLGSYRYFQEAFLFYAGGSPFIRPLNNEEELKNFLAEGENRLVFIREKDLQKLSGTFPLKVVADQSIGHRHVYLVQGVSP